MRVLLKRVKVVCSMHNNMISVVILTYNEELHIARCIRSLRGIAKDIFIIDSFSTDNTVELAESLGANVYQHPWKNYADQFQWGLDNCPIETEWVMRMDADEYLEPALQSEIKLRLLKVDQGITGVYLKRKVVFYGTWIRYGGFYPQILLRIWRKGSGRIEQRWMDEHIVLPDQAQTIQFEENLVDENLKGITFWVNKHNSYATREMIDLLNNKYPLFEKDEAVKSFDDPQAKRKRQLKDNIYSKLPLGLRALFYFLYRYVFKLGFLDGGKGFVFHMMQGLWYRMLVDVKIMELESKCKGNVNNIRKVLKDEYGISL